MEFPTKMYIEGKLAAGAGNLEVVNPATAEEIATVATAGLRDAEKALKAAQSAFPAWAEAPVKERRRRPTRTGTDLLHRWSTTPRR